MVGALERRRALGDRIRDLRVGDEERDLRPLGLRPRLREDFTEVLAVEDDNPVEALEVLGAKRPGTVPAKVDLVRAGDAASTRVSAEAARSLARPRARHLHVVDPARGEPASQDRLRKRRAASVAEADEEDPHVRAGGADAAGVDTTHDKTWAQLVDHAYSHFVEPELIQPTIVYDWPIEMSPFARTTDDDPAIVERFEAVVGGMEFANAFSELNDSEEQAGRFAMQAEEKAAGDATAEGEDPDYVEALSYGMPPTGGLGIGIDRITMVLAGRDAIRDVILFPALRERE